MKKMLTFFILWMLVLAGILSMAGCSMRFRKVRIGTAGIGGNYYSFGKTFSEFLMGDISTVDVKVISTAGSAENLKMITGQKPQIDLAIIQADILNEMEEEKDPAIGAVAGMYAEALQIAVRQDSGIKSVEDLRGKTISLGETNSGTERNAQVVLEAYGLNDGAYEACHLKYTDASRALEDGTIDDTIIIPRGVKTLSINPLNWETDDTMAERTLNKGAVMETGGVPIPELCGAYIGDRGQLVVTDIDRDDYPPVLDLLPDGSYHLYDYMFFFTNLKDNVALRSDTYLEAHGLKKDKDSDKDQDRDRDSGEDEDE